MTDAMQALKEPARWWHSINLGDRWTAGAKTPQIIQAEADLIFKNGVAGKTVLDIGAWDGFFSFEAEKRGASRVLATDHIAWGGWGWSTKAGFDFAHDALKSKVEDREIDVPDLSVETVGTFDVVLFLGVLYHLEDPYAELKRVGALANETLIVETATALNNLSEPAARFWPSASLNNDTTNFWTPNVACLDAMLRGAGFKEVEVVEAPPLSRPPAGSLVGRHIAFARR